MSPDAGACDLTIGARAPVRRFALNAAGRDFVVGDVHGMFTLLEELLDEVSFDETRDRLFSVGDLVDRGPQSERLLEWLGKEWFNACRGNHEQLLLDASDPQQADIWMRYNGGAWWAEVDEAVRAAMREAVAALPLAIEVTTANGPVGIVHADVPPGLSWEEFLVGLETGDGACATYAMWSRNRVAGALICPPVGGAVERIYCGHTPTREVVCVDNVYYIDTGAVYAWHGYPDARLTLVQVHPQRHVEHSRHASAPGFVDAAGLPLAGA